MNTHSPFVASLLPLSATIAGAVPSRAVPATLHRSVRGIDGGRFIRSRVNRACTLLAARGADKSAAPIREAVPC